MLCCCVYIQATLISREYSLADAFARETYVLDELGVYMLCYTLLHMEDIPVRAYIPPLGSNQSTKESGRRETGGDYVPLVFSCFSCLPRHPCLFLFLSFFFFNFSAAFYFCWPAAGYKACTYTMYIQPV